MRDEYNVCTFETCNLRYVEAHDPILVLQGRRRDTI